MKWGKIILVIFGALLVTALGIDASDTISGSKSTLLSQVISYGGNAKCPDGMTQVENMASITCVDTYEASPSKDCPNQILNNILMTEENINSEGCKATSVANATPWNFVSLSQASRLCISAGKRLPTSDEWFRLVVGTVSQKCVIQANTFAKTGSQECVSSSGIHDMVGNVWEWVDENVVGNTFNGRTLPGEGYVTSVDADGIAITSGNTADELYGSDYFWSKEEGVFGMIRGGFYGSNKDAGLYTVNASVLTSFATQGVGFRCVEDLL